MHSYYNIIIRLTLPSIVSNITVPLLGMVDLAITGHLDNEAYIGAIAVGGMLFNILYWMFAFLRMGTSGMTAQAYGEQDNSHITGTLYRGAAVAFIISTAMIVLSPLLFSGAMAFIQPSCEVRQLVARYFYICIWGAPASLLLFVLNGWFIGMQNTRIPMAIAIFQNILNILSSLFLVYGIGMKLEGIALGTVTAQWGGAAAAVYMLYRKYSGYISQKMSLKEMLRGGELRLFLTINRDIFFRTLCMISIHFFFISAGAKGGDTILAVNAVFMQFFTLYSYFIDGLAYAGEAMVGKAIGAKRVVDYRHTVRGLFVCGIVLTTLFTILYAFCNGWITRLFTDNAQVIACAGEYLHWTLFFPFCGMAAFIWDGIYIGATESRSMLASTLAGMLMFFAIYLTLEGVYHNHALWVAFLCNLAMRGIVLTYMRKKILSHHFST